MDAKKLIKIKKAPENWEIIQHVGGFADIEICGEFCPDTADDTEQVLDFNPKKICLRVVKEDDGTAVTPLFAVNVNGEKFCATVKVPVGGPYLLDIVMYDGEKGVCYPVRGEKRHHFCVGDVYLIAGQSNAAGMGKGIAEEAPETGVHVFRNLEAWDIASHPFNDYDYSKQSMFLCFAKKIKKETGVPIGLIPAAMGGAPLSRWVKTENGDLYRKMLGAVGNMKIKAVLWYQGCADAGDGVSTEDYLNRFNSFVSSIREDFKNSTLPFFTFQLNRQRVDIIKEIYNKKYDNIREAQRRASRMIDNVYVLPTVDSSNMTDFIHNSRTSNIMLGERLAAQVLHEVYNKGTEFFAPDISGAWFEDEKTVKLEFENVTEFLYTFNSNADNLQIKINDEKGNVPLENYNINKNIITLHLQRECAGKAYARGHSGIDPDKLIIDFGTQLPMLGFCEYCIEEKKNEC